MAPRNRSSTGSGADDSTTAVASLRIAMPGGSYVGITQLLAAGRRPDHLAAIAPQVAMSDMYRDAFTHGGVMSPFFDAQYLAVQGVSGLLGLNTDPNLLRHTVEAKLGQSPPGTLAFDYLERPNDTPFYRRRLPINVAHRIEVPVLLLGGWRDGLSQGGAPELYRVLANWRGVETRLSMDPCTHKGCGAPFAPMTDPPNQQDPGALVFEFMPRHLLGERTPKRPPAEYHLQGAGRCAATGPARGRPGRRHTSRSRRPGLSMAFDQYGTVAAAPYVPTDQRLEGPHGLAFRTRALKRPLALAGPLALHLHASSTATDTDFHARLLDVAPDGSESVITSGALRASHRRLDREKSTSARPWHPHTDPQPVEPGGFHRYPVEL